MKKLYLSGLVGILGIIHVLAVLGVKKSGDGELKADNLPLGIEFVSAPVANECAECHKKIVGHRHVDQWLESAHAKMGIGCIDCHGDVHQIPSDRSLVSGAVCGKCHKAEEDACNQGRHVQAFDSISKLLADTETPTTRELTCVRCHQIDEATLHKQLTGVKCASCHFEHSYSLKIAKNSNTCRSCHEGIDSPQWEVYASSRHGALVNGVRIAECVDCHDPHNDSCGIGLGKGGNGAFLINANFPLEVNLITRTQLATKRKEMVSKCVQCHKTDRVTEELRHADQIKMEADFALAQIVEMVHNAKKSGLLGHLKKNPGALNESFFTKIDELNPNGTRLEQLMFSAGKHYHPLMWKAAYHQSPSKVLEARRELDRLTREVERELSILRDDAADLETENE